MARSMQGKGTTEGEAKEGEGKEEGGGEMKKKKIPCRPKSVARELIPCRHFELARVKHN